MKNAMLIMCLLGFSFVACTEKSQANTEEKEVIENLEKENEELKELETEIENDVKELDQLLNELDENL